jgi:uncharacterized membrane protein YccC
MNLTLTEIIMGVVIAALIAGFAAYLFWAQRKFEELEKQVAKPIQNPSMAIAAYERLTLFAERMKLSSLVQRLPTAGSTVRELQLALNQSIREEYDHNITQQLYVKKEIWEAVTKMKEQNTYIVNQIAATLPSDDPALELSRKLALFEAENPNATLNKMVLDALQYEVKQLI